MKTIIGSVVAAAAASGCCLGPAVLSAVGAGALGAAAVKLEAFRPLFLAATVTLLGAGFVVTSRRSPPEHCATDGSCAPSSNRKAKVVLWLATIAVILLVAFPYYVSWLV